MATEPGLLHQVGSTAAQNEMRAYSTRAAARDIRTLIQLLDQSDVRTTTIDALTCAYVASATQSMGWFDHPMSARPKRLISPIKT